ncbi:peptidylprolyl isomerase [bacterium]|nr:peptidylprolyl isomerase [bacterium]
MLQTLRNNMRYIMFVVAAAFILTIVFSWGMGGFKNKRTKVQSGILATVNNQKIMYQTFALLVEQEIKQIKESQDKTSLTDYEIQSIREKVWNETLRDLLMTQEVKRLGIQTTANEIFMHLENNPPPFIKNHEAFQTDGEFDIQKYHQILRDRQYANAWVDAENYLRSTLPMQKLGSWLLSTIRVTEEELKQAYALKNNRVNVQYVNFNPYRYPMDSIEITDQEIQTYYKEHKDEFKLEEQRKIKYVKFNLDPTKEDTALLKSDAGDLILRLREGEDFASLAQTESEDPGSAERGGDLGFFGRGDMVKPFEDAAFNAPVGKIIGPVESNYGLHIIKVTDRKRENGETKVKASHILLKYKASPETHDRVNESASYFSDELLESDDYTFDELAKREGYETEESTLFSKGGFIPGVGMSMTMNRLTFRENLGYVSPPIDVNNQLYVFQVSDIEEAHIQPINEVKTKIERALRHEKQKQMAMEDCKLFWEKMQSSDFEESAAENSLEIKETGLFTFESGAPQIGKDPKLMGAAFGLSVGDTSSPIETDRGCYILKVLDKTEFNESDFKSQKESLKQELINRKMNTYYMTWMEKLKADAEIEDFREAYF